VGVVFGGGGEPVAAFPCSDDSCGIRPVRLMFALEYSSAMDQPFDAQTTRLERAIEAIEAIVDFDNGFIAQTFVLGLMRFGSDPDPNAPDTAIFGDVTGLRDGVKLDVPWYNALDPGKKYIECTDGSPIVEALAGLPAPPGGTGSWTKGALEFTKAYIAASDADHPQDLGKRGALVVLYTAGIWTDPTGAQKLGPAAADPISTATELAGLGVPTHVVNVGGQPGKLFADPLAKAGGTGQALHVDDLQGVASAFNAFVAQLKNEKYLPVCEPGIPRMMFLLDASSAMLNVGPAHGQPGQSAWDQVREVLAGQASVLGTILNNNQPLDEIGRFGLVAFGGEGPGEHTLVVQYDHCPRQRIAWGLDPWSSCEAPGCVDPYAPPPIVWTSHNGAEIDPPGFDQDVLSHMPRCDLDPQTPEACTGSGRLTHLGLERVAANLATYKAQCLAPGSAEPCNEDTPFLNMLITDGPSVSTDAQVEAQLVSLFDAGVVTRVFGLGDAVDPSQLEAMAAWGSGGAFPASFAADGDELADAIADMLVSYIEKLTFDECCSFDQKCTLESGTDTGSTSEDSGSDGGDTNGSGDTTEGVASTGPSGSTSSSGSTSPTSSTDSMTPTTGSMTPMTPTTTASSPTSEAGSTTGEEQVNASDAGCGCASQSARTPHALLLLLFAGLLRRRACPLGRPGRSPT